MILPIVDLVARLEIKHQEVDFLTRCIFDKCGIHFLLETLYKVSTRLKVKFTHEQKTLQTCTQHRKESNSQKLYFIPFSVSINGQINSCDPG